MEQNIKYIEELLEKFFEGLTSYQEEQELYKYFSENNIPKHLEKYKAMLQYFETEMEGELESIFEEKNGMIVGANECSKKHTLLNKWMVGISAIAASLLLLFLINPFTNSKEFNPYEGSYIKKDGVIIYDIDEIEAERARIEFFVEQKLASLDKPFQQAEEQLDEYEDIESQIKQLTNTIEE